MAVCAIENRRESVNIAGIGHEYAEKVENAIDSFIGNKDQYSKSDLVVYNKIYKLLNNFFNKNSLMINSVSDPQIFIDGLLKEYQLKSTGNIGVLNSDTIKYSKNALSGIFNRTKHIISRMEKQSKKGNVNDFATMLREPFMVGVLNDPSGLMNVLSKKIQAFTDRRGQRFLAKKTRIDDSREPLNSLLQDRLSGEFTDNIANEYIANGLEGFTVYDGIKGSKTEGRRTTVEVMKVENITEGDGENAKVTVKDSDGNTETLGVIFNTKEGIFNK